MTHTSTEQPEALRLAYEQKIGDWVVGTAQWCEEVANELIRLHARVQELEASQAQRVPLSDEAMWKILDKTHNLPEFDSYELDALFQAGRNVEAACIGFTQEKHG
ncbi:hypothetical protein [Comamonas jiangduensis]|uniref:hypothetical protein n=1 Tax=Comamonas jiangduensis TaxID=1194168 RepID=UPI003BF7CB4E